MRLRDGRFFLIVLGRRGRAATLQRVCVHAFPNNVAVVLPNRGHHTMAFAERIPAGTSLGWQAISSHLKLVVAGDDEANKSYHLVKKIR